MILLTGLICLRIRGSGWLLLSAVNRSRVANIAADGTSDGFNVGGMGVCLCRLLCGTNVQCATYPL